MESLTHKKGNFECNCKKIRDDKQYWQQVESYVSTHSEAQFSHGICPDCYKKYIQPELDKISNKNTQK